MSKDCTRPIIRDTDGDFSGCCKKAAGLKELDQIPRTLRGLSVPSFDQDVLQDEAGFGIRDEQTNTFLFDDLRRF